MSELEQPTDSDGARRVLEEVSSRLQAALADALAELRSGGSWRGALDDVQLAVETVGEQLSAIVGKLDEGEQR